MSRPGRYPAASPPVFKLAVMRAVLLSERLEVTRQIKRRELGRKGGVCLKEFLSYAAPSDENGRGKGGGLC